MTFLLQQLSPHQPFACHFQWLACALCWDEQPALKKGRCSSRHQILSSTQLAQIHPPPVSQVVIYRNKSDFIGINATRPGIKKRHRQEY